MRVVSGDNLGAEMTPSCSTCSGKEHGSVNFGKDMRGHRLVKLLIISTYLIK